MNPRRRLIPAYLATGGRERPAGGRDFDRMTLLVQGPAAPAAGECGPEHLRLWELLGPGALTLVECAAHLGLPVSATVFLAADLVDGGHLLARSAVPEAEEIDRSLIERLLVGLRSLH
ncbi:DUF742 domain-containing protein [Streptomyces sp. CA-111067]|jgi:hypothetical protein|uniref:DUF742 domain-containing protein n=1 Tax=Streptomyces sp. CA-111067 TaxID=3240046 RepID=UPI003D98B0D1